MGVLQIIKLSLWGGSAEKMNVSRQEYEEMKMHAVTALPANILSGLSLSGQLKEIWRKDIMWQISQYYTYAHVQAQLPIAVPYVILKGTAAAQYYPYPEYRMQGDIDIMTKHEDYEQSCRELTDAGWTEMTNRTDLERGRHRTFQKGNVILENHAFFASMNDPVKAKLFDDLILDNITENHILPDLINGLVLIDHVNQHLEEGIGLRQIIDWMMFADRCLKDDGEWHRFEEIAEKTGLRTLAVTTTRMCEIYLGLPAHTWSAKADKKLCANLMDYVMKSGNFGNKKDKEEELAIVRMNRLRHHPVKALKELQKMGQENWDAGRKPFLRHFAWVWQGFRYIKGTSGYMDGYRQARRLSSFFDALGVKRTGDGLVYYIDGEYVKK